MAPRASYCFAPCHRTRHGSAPARLPRSPSVADVSSRILSVGLATAASAVSRSASARSAITGSASALRICSSTGGRNMSTPHGSVTRSRRRVARRRDRARSDTACESIARVAACRSRCGQRSDLGLVPLHGRRVKQVSRILPGLLTAHRRKCRRQLPNMSRRPRRDTDRGSSDSSHLVLLDRS